MTEAVNDIAPKEDAAVRAASGPANQDGNTVDMKNKAQTRTDAPSSGDKLKGDPASQKDTSDTKTTSSSRYNTDIYGRVPGKEPKYPIPCPNCKRELAVSRFCQHLEKCMGLGGRGVSSSSYSSK